MLFLTSTMYSLRLLIALAAFSTSGKHCLETTSDVTALSQDVRNLAVAKNMVSPRCTSWKSGVKLLSFKKHISGPPCAPVRARGNECRAPKLFEIHRQLVCPNVGSWPKRTIRALTHLAVCVSSILIWHTCDLAWVVIGNYCLDVMLAGYPKHLTVDLYLSSKTTVTLARTLTLPGAKVRSCPPSWPPTDACMTFCDIC
jgi:hypothetical protein